MTASLLEFGHKQERESRLRWQSRLLLALTLTISSLGWLLKVMQMQTTATLEGVTICAVFGLLVWRMHAATPMASFTGFVLTSGMYLSTVQQPDGGWFHTALLPGLSLFALAFAATRFRRSYKEQHGLAESRRGRGASQVAANMGVAALAAHWLPALAARVLPQALGSGHTEMLHSPLLTGSLVAALAEAAADTISSEIGQALGRRTILITTWKQVAAGTDGAVSGAGTAAGCLAAFVVVLTAVPTIGLSWPHASVTWLAAIGGLFADSLLGASLERSGFLNNDMVNFMSTAVAAVLAGLGCLSSS